MQAEHLLIVGEFNLEKLWSLCIVPVTSVRFRAYSPDMFNLPICGHELFRCLVLVFVGIDGNLL
jgi:hypothetical protein